MRSVREIPVLQNIPVIVRGALNVPVENGHVADDYRLKKALPTITFLAGRGARVVLMSHIGEQGTETLAPVVDALRHFIPQIRLCPVTTGEEARAAARAPPPRGALLVGKI